MSQKTRFQTCGCTVTFFRKEFQMSFSEIFIDHVISRRTCFSWSAMNLGIIQCLIRVFCLSNVVSRKGYGGKILQAWNRVFVTFFVCLNRLFHHLKTVSGERNGGKILKKCGAFFSLRPIDPLSTCRYRCINKPEISFCGTFSRAPVAFFEHSKLFLQKEMEEKFWKKFEVFYSLKLIDRVITCCNRCVNRPEIAFFVTFSRTQVAFFELQKSFLEKGMEEKVLFSRGLIDQVIKISILCPRRSRIAWFITSKVSKSRFSSKKPRSWRRDVNEKFWKNPRGSSQLYQPIL